MIALHFYLNKLNKLFLVASFSNVVTTGTCPIRTTSTVAIGGSRLTGTTVVLLVLVVTVSFQLQVIMGLLQLPIRMIHHILPDVLD
jgi:hypothetical protein